MTAPVCISSSVDHGRRRILALPLIVPQLAASGPTVRRARSPHVVVLGAGAFGGWTALQLLRQSARVTLVDPWGAGHSRASSGGETRVIRAVYADRIYVEMAARAFELWRDHERRTGLKLYRRLGAIWMVSGTGALERGAMDHLKSVGLKAEELTPAEAARRYPQIRFDDVKWVLKEDEAGALSARRACESVLDAFRAEGGEYREVHAQPGPIAGREMAHVKLSDGSELRADQYLFACGPWLGEVFPDVIGQSIRPTRQEVFFFGTPPGDARFTDAQLPVWIDDGARFFYGIPGNLWRGFKIADDTRGPAMNPTTDERTITPAALDAARQFVAHRFPGLASAPLVDARVCQYENSPDGHFIIDRHPSAQNVWIAGGGSGHGFKFGPALGERIAATVLGKRSVDAFFGLARLR
jgi:glycine/D-amino acid oxidase-like deaminating enzyme